MLPKSERLTKEDFKGPRAKVFFRGELFEASFSKSSTNKFACVISKKKIKTAVERNTIKRRIYEAVHEIKIQNKISYTSGSIIFYIKAISEDTPYKDIKEEILKAFATLQ